MKKKLFIIVSAVLVFTSCPMDSTGNSGPVFYPLPDGVYIAGISDGQACYLAGDTRVMLDGARASSITVSDGIVFVKGWYNNYAIQNIIPCYWINDVRYDIQTNDVSMVDGKFYTLYNDKVWLDGVQMTPDNFSVSRFTVHEGVVYAIMSSYGSSSYAIGDNAYYNIPKPNGATFSFYPRNITVSEDGLFFILVSASQLADGSWTDRYWYYDGSEYIELEDVDVSNWTLSMRAFNNNVYVTGFSVDSTYTTQEDQSVHLIATVSRVYCWVNGKKETIEMPDNSIIEDVKMFGGKIYVIGSYITGTYPTTTQACYWIDGERFDLDITRATAIFVEE